MSIDKTQVVVLRNLHIAAAVIHIISCALSVVVHTNDANVDITLPTHEYTMVDNVVHTTTTFERVLEQSPLVWISANEGFTTFSHLIAIFYLVYNPNNAKLESLRRTIEYSFTAGILQVALVMGAGSVTLYDVFFLLVSNVVLQAIGYAIDGSKRKGLLYTSAFALLAVQIQYVALNAWRVDGISIDWALVMGIFYILFYVGFGVVKLLPLKPKTTDEMYILMSVTSKITLSWVLIGNIFDKFRELGATTDPDFTNLDWRAIQVVIVVCTTIGLAVGTVLLTCAREENDKAYGIKNGTSFGERASLTASSDDDEYGLSDPDNTTTRFRY